MLSGTVFQLFCNYEALKQFLVADRSALTEGKLELCCQQAATPREQVELFPILIGRLCGFLVPDSPTEVG